MRRRTFLSATLAAAGLHAAEATGQISGSNTENAADNLVLVGSPVVSGPAPEAITILQLLSVAATGYLEYSVEDGPLQRVDAASGGLLPYEQHVLKFRLPALPHGKQIRYWVTAREVNWIPVKQFVHGTIVQGEPEIGKEHSFRTLDPQAEETRFVVWNDTHENAATLATLANLTSAATPDFLLWNGDQTNDVHYESEMGMQVLTPGGQELAARWPLAYVRGNHDLRGPAARHMPDFTGTPEDRFYYAFRSGPLAAVVMDTGEDKPDDHPALGGLAAFAKFRERQTRLAKEGGARAMVSGSAVSRAVLSPAAVVDSRTARHRLLGIQQAVSRCLGADPRRSRSTTCHFRPHAQSRLDAGQRESAAGAIDWRWSAAGVCDVYRRTRDAQAADDRGSGPRRERAAQRRVGRIRLRRSPPPAKPWAERDA